MLLLITLITYIVICFADSEDIVDTTSLESPVDSDDNTKSSTDTVEAPIDIVTSTESSEVYEDQEPKFDFMGEVNSATHFTTNFRIQNYSKTLVLRRGAHFRFGAIWNRECDSDDDISLFFKLMTFKGNNKVTINIIANETPDDVEQWSALYFCVSNNTGYFVVTIPITASIGAYGLILTTKHQGKSKSYVVHQNIGVIFNPYSKKDSMFMEDEELEEYVENEYGYIWFGSTTKQSKKFWLYGQFEEIALNATFYALNMCNLTAEERSSPVDVSRAVSAISNHQDDWGILIGRWDGDYVDIWGQKATPPTRWLGSVAILEYFRESRMSVPYGQCWVFAGVMTTMLRALGIPSRPVTCYTCGHDSDNNLMIDFFLDENGKKLNKSHDSFWNYHVWVQAYMRRLDLSQNGIFDGWQDVDGTPQEKSGEKFQLGPTPVNAVKLGIVDAQYDLPFVYAEVNGDVVWWREDQILYIETTKIGTSLLTKAIGGKGAVDITATYKAEERSKEERDTLRRICDQLNIAHPSFNASIKQRSKEMNKLFFIDIRTKDTINLGESLSIVVQLKPLSWNQFKKKNLNIKTIRYTLTVETMHYDGHTAKEVKVKEELITIKNANGLRIKTILNPMDYETSEDYDYFLITFTAKDVDSDALVFKQKEVHINSPPMTVTVNGRSDDQQNITLTVTYTNPLTKEAYNCALVVETELRQRQVILFKTLGAKQTMIKKVNVTAPTDDKDLVLLAFSCDDVIATEAEVRLNDH